MVTYPSPNVFKRMHTFYHYYVLYETRHGFWKLFKKSKIIVPMSILNRNFIYRGVFNCTGNFCISVSVSFFIILFVKWTWVPTTHVNNTVNLFGNTMKCSFEVFKAVFKCFLRFTSKNWLVNLNIPTTSFNSIRIDRLSCIDNVWLCRLYYIDNITIINNAFNLRRTSIRYDKITILFANKYYGNSAW